MAESIKEELLRSIISLRRKLKVTPNDNIREISIFEEQLSKSFRRVDQLSYLGKKFSRAELEEIQKAYEALLDSKG